MCYRYNLKLQQSIFLWQQKINFLLTVSYFKAISLCLFYTNVCPVKNRTTNKVQIAFN